MDKVTNQHIRKRSAEPLAISVTRRNLVNITQSYNINMVSEVNKVTKDHLGHLTFDHDRLVDTRTKMKNDYGFSVLNPSTVKIIRRLRLNK